MLGHKSWMQPNFCSFLFQIHEIRDKYSCKTSLIDITDNVRQTVITISQEYLYSHSRLAPKNFYVDVGQRSCYGNHGSRDVSYCLVKFLSYSMDKGQNAIFPLEIIDTFKC